MKTPFTHAQTPFRVAEWGRGIDDVSLCGDGGELNPRPNQVHIMLLQCVVSPLV